MTSKNLTLDPELNFVRTGGQFGWKRRLATYNIQRTDSGKFRAIDEYTGHFAAQAPTLEGLEKMLRPMVDWRTCPR